MNFESAFEFMKHHKEPEVEENAQERLFRNNMTIDEKLSVLNGIEIQNVIYDEFAINQDDSMDTLDFSPRTSITNFTEGNGYFHAYMTHHYDNEGSDYSEEFYEIFVNPDTENISIINKDYTQIREYYSFAYDNTLTDLMKEHNLNLVRETDLETNRETDLETNENSGHVITFNITFESEAIGTCDILDGDTGKTYSLAVWDGGHKAECYICPLDPKINMEEREVTFLHDVLPHDLLERVQQAYETENQDSMVLIGTDLNYYHQELVEGERYANWMERIEEGNPNFSDKELEIYQSMKKDGYPEIETMEARINAKDNDMSLNKAERIIDKYVDKMNEKSPLIQSSTENDYKNKYYLHSVDVDGDTLKMKYLNRQDLGFSAKTFTYNQDTGIVSEIDTTITKGVPQSHLVDRISIKEIETNINTQKEEKTVTRITQNQMEGMER